MRVICISDTHQEHCDPSWLPRGDVLIHCGDITNDGTIGELQRFNLWLATLDFKHKLVIGGNHDRFLAVAGSLGKQIISAGTFLENELVEIDGVKFYGSPPNAINGEWYGNMDRERDVARISEGIDILFTHGPAYGVNDTLISDSSHGEKGEHGGCEFLLDAVKRTKPKYHVFGHLHEGYGEGRVENTVCYNVALASTTLWYGQYRQPMIIDI